MVLFLLLFEIFEKCDICNIFFFRSVFYIVSITWLFKVFSFCISYLIFVTIVRSVITIVSNAIAFVTFK